MSLIERVDPREIRFTTGINPHHPASVLAEFGKTKVYITAIIERKVPPWMKDQGKGWVTAEYAMLPGSSDTRIRRERKSVSGRTQEIQRLIGRSLRAIVDLEKMGECSILIDCDVLVADGGTRTTSISGAYIALQLAVDYLMREGVIHTNPIIEPLAALSVGINKEGRVIADLNYIEDSSCETDMNIVMTRSGKFVEIQGTAEGEPFSRQQLDALLECAESALKNVFAAQEKVLNAHG